MHSWLNICFKNRVFVRSLVIQGGKANLTAPQWWIKSSGASFKWMEGCTRIQKKASQLVHTLTKPWFWVLTLGFLTLRQRNRFNIITNRVFHAACAAPLTRPGLPRCRILWGPSKLDARGHHPDLHIWVKKCTPAFVTLFTCSWGFHTCNHC